MRILHLGKYYPPCHGGMETVLENIACGLVEAGDEVSVLVSGTDGLTRRGPLIPGRSQGAGLLVRCGRPGTWNSQPLTWDLYAELRRLLRTERPDLVHLHLPNPLAAAAWLAVSATTAPAPVLAVWHHADMRRQRLTAPLVRPLVRRCLHRAAGVCASSAELAATSAELAGLRDVVRVIPFGIAAPDPGELPPTRKGPFLFVGRLVPYKGVGVLLEAVARVPDAELQIVGDGPRRFFLQQRARALGISGRVHFTGSVDHAALARLLREARALVLPSLDAGETFGLVQLEAMAAGCAVIASDLPTGVAGVGVPEQTALLTAPGDVAALAMALGRLQEDPDLAAKLGSAGRARYLARYRPERMIRELRSWYGELLAGARRDGISS